MARTDITVQVTEMLEGYLEGKELEIYRVQYKKEGPDWVLRVCLDKPAGAESEYVGTDECEEVARFLSEKLDETELIDRKYNLEVASPGLDRELIKDSDYERFSGRQVEVRTYEPVNGSKYFEGILLGKADGNVSIETGGDRITINESKISKINLAVVF